MFLNYRQSLSNINNSFYKGTAYNGSVNFYAPSSSPNNVGQYYVNPMMNAPNGEGPAQMRKLFIGGLNHETTDEQLKEYYSQWGTVVDCIVIRDPATKHSRGFGFVTYQTIVMAENSMNERPHTINGKVVDPKRAIPREQMLPLTSTNSPHFLECIPNTGCKLSLSGIHWDFHTVDGIRTFYNKFGAVEQVEILGSPRGMGFVVFEDKISADNALALSDEHIINGRQIKAKRCNDVPPVSKRIYVQPQPTLFTVDCTLSGSDETESSNKDSSVYSDEFDSDIAYEYTQ